MFGYPIALAGQLEDNFRKESLNAHYKKKKKKKTIIFIKPAASNPVGYAVVSVVYRAAIFYFLNQ